MKSKLNIVFAPISVSEGMAGSKRLGNLVYFLLRDSNKICNFILGKRKKQNEIVQTHYFDYFGWASLRSLKQIFDSTRINVLYFYGYPRLDILHILIYARLLGYKVLLDIVEDISTIQKFHSAKQKIRIKSNLFLLKKSKYFTDGIIVISNYLENFIRELGINLPLIKLSISINKEFFNLKSRAPKRQDGLIKVFYGGSYSFKEGIEPLLEAYKEIDETYPERLQFVFSGNGPVRYMNNFSSLLEKLQISNTKVLGFITDEKYYNVLFDCDILIMPRLANEYAKAGFPFKLGEYMAAGKIVVATDVGEVNTVLDNSCGYLIEPNKESFVNVLNEILLHYNEAKLKGHPAQVKAFELFDASIHTNNLVSFIKFLS